MDNTPIFVKIDEYKDIIKVVDVINEKVDHIRNTLSDLQEMKQKEDEHIENWNDQLDKVTQKMDYINKTLQNM